jgi:hypothetical protein
MNLHFTICPLASVVLALVIIINILDIYSVGTSVFLLSFNVIVSIIFVWIANKTCFSYHWVSWIIVAYLLLTVLIITALLFLNKPDVAALMGSDENPITKQKELVKKIQDLEKQMFTA